MPPPDFNGSLNVVIGDTCLESTCGCGSQFCSKVVYPFPLKTKCTMHSSNFRDRRHQKSNTTVGEEKERGKEKNIYQTPFVLNTIENFSAVCAAANSPRLRENKPFVITHFQATFQFLNISKEQYDIFLN